MFRTCVRTRGKFKKYCYAQHPANLFPSFAFLLFIQAEQKSMPMRKIAMGYFMINPRERANRLHTTLNASVCKGVSLSTE